MSEGLDWNVSRSVCVCEYLHMLVLCILRTYVKHNDVPHQREGCQACGDIVAAAGVCVKRARYVKNIELHNVHINQV